MEQVSPTRKRLLIVEDIRSQIHGFVGLILLGGSMGYGQEFSVTDKSDIDMVIVCDKDRVDDLMQTDYFRGHAPDDVVEMFKRGVINLFWVTRVIDGIDVNSFIYETCDYKKFCLLEGSIKGYIGHEPESTQESYGFDGKILSFTRNVSKHGNGWLYSKPALADGKYWGGPPRSDFLFKPHITYQEDGFFDSLKPMVWKAVIDQLIKEHGPSVDLKRYNILNTDFTFQKHPEKLPREVIKEIIKNTEHYMEISKE